MLTRDSPRASHEAAKALAPKLDFTPYSFNDELKTPTSVAKRTVDVMFAAMRKPVATCEMWVLVTRWLF